MSAWFGEVGVADHGTDGDAAFGRGGDLGEAEVIDIDERGRCLDAILHQVDEVGAARQELGAVGRARVDGVVGSGGALVVEGIHADTPRATDRTAATMFG